MPRATRSFAKHLVKLKGLLSIRARLAVIALILTVPLMADRVRDLEANRSLQIRQASADLVTLARRGAQAHRDVTDSVQGYLTTLARAHAAYSRRGEPCGLFHDNFRTDIDWIGNLSVVSSEERIVCSTNAKSVGLDMSDRSYVDDARAARTLILSNYMINRGQQMPTVMAALAVSSVDERQSDVLIAPISLHWLDHLARSVSARTTASLWLVDDRGTVQVTHGAETIRAAKIFVDGTLARLMRANDAGIETVPDDQGRRAVFAFERVPGTQARLVIGTSEESILGAVDRDIRRAMLQLMVGSLLVLLGAWFLGEWLLIRPIRILTISATRFGRGDLTARAPLSDLPPEFVPLANSFNGMADELSSRERELRANNNRLAVLATVDTVSGLANRRGFESRMDFEWMRAIETGQPLGLLMIDVDHFKQFNDTYGHPEGDACLRRLGSALAEIANATPGFAARYGGEEFLMLLPAADEARTSAVGEEIRQIIEGLNVPHRASSQGRVTVSIGAASLCPTRSANVQALIDAADAGLYAAKGRGRNQVVAHGVIETGPIDIDTDDDAESEKAESAASAAPM